MRILRVFPFFLEFVEGFHAFFSHCINGFVTSLTPNGFWFDEASLLQHFELVINRAQKPGHRKSRIHRTLRRIRSALRRVLLGARVPHVDPGMRANRHGSAKNPKD